ncbi:alpha-tocopherol transfer protein-like [Neodiprion pinetum]|uniref:Alpha-tocopherol transfer protein n=1 Tax=Neodiprion lecontei TaxID=441921 RepID=A0A6J0C1Q8_NEOLC|nr:alpha-tocopherol transfer protein [Neodiprion lecontei]XP_015520371.1 alpha-tocopherol transfer protein [Neodiprion lecontei]XP_046474137.1 alpha-tocopherol transfer protein-like [Neodiprion pinetum]XP_046474138.1 alpha-tocopherol transfer protein-like [Neodiprion pinetum]XP_046474140.1 alpha-tocopherol transfer protein-like [Neodiprion pinetum]XP_046591654.1 alpha-tocopherol transfer protein [Neodiprion lecontei]
MMHLGHTIQDSRAKYPELTDEVLDDLQKWTEARGIPGVPVEQLALFTHSCYYDREATLRCMSVYYRMRATIPEFFANRDPKMECLQHSLRALQFVGLPVPDPQGNRIIFHRLADSRPSQYIFNDGIKLLAMAVDASLYSDGCSPGYIFLFDMQGVRLGHLTRLSVSSIRKFFEYIQEGLPVRLKGIHVLNAVWFMDKVLSLIRPFMKRELFDMLHLYTGDVSEVYDHIPQKCLPKDFGGDLAMVEDLHEAHTLKLLELRDYFLEEERLFRGGCSAGDSKISSSSSALSEDLRSSSKSKDGCTASAPDT